MSSDVESLISQYAPAADLHDIVTPQKFFLDSCKDMPFLAAPMAGVTNSAYRIMNRLGGAQYAYSEMVSVAGLCMNNQATRELCLPHTAEPNLIVQLFGSDPMQFQRACALVGELLGDKLSCIDINMACPVPKVTKRGEGSALMCDPHRACALVRACLREVKVPVTCKIRRGYYMEHESAAEFGRALQDAGASALAVHGRFAKQLYKGEANWESIKRVVEAVDIPVIASGDVMSAEDAWRILYKTQAHAVLIARGTYGNPWIFDDALKIFNEKKLLFKGNLSDLSSPLDAGLYNSSTSEHNRHAHITDTHSISARLNALELHLRLLAATHAHMARARSLCSWYLYGLSHAALWRQKFMTATTLDEFLHLLEEFKEQVQTHEHVPQEMLSGR